MKNKIFLLVSFLLGIGFFQSKNNLPPNSRVRFFCDTNPPNGIQISNITPTSCTVSWTPDSNTPNYVLRYRETGSTVWTMVNSITSGQSTYNITDLIACNNYEVQVASVCASQGIWSDSVYFLAEHTHGISKSQDSSRIYISGVTVVSTGGTQMVSNSGASNYSDYKNDTTRNIYLTPGSTGNTVVVNRAIGSGDPLSWTRYKIIVAWIDFNGNGLFEVDERIMQPSYLPRESVGPISATFNVPSSFTGGNCGVMMRVLHCFWDYLSSVGTYSYGETEDYKVYPFNASLSTDEIKNHEKISIYPNPASDILNIDGLSSNTIVAYEIFSVTGQKVDEGKVSGNAVQISRLVKGVYFLQIKTKEGASRLKFIKK